MMTLWDEALRVAGTPLPDDEWRQTLATALHHACGGVFASVITCVPGNWFHLRWSSTPGHFDTSIQEIVNDYLSRMDRAESWDKLLAKHGPVLAPLEQTKHRILATEMADRVLRPRGVHGFVVGYCLDSSRALVGMLCLGSTNSSQELLAQVASPLGDVAVRVGETLDRALALARGCGAVFPSRRRGIDGLTAREEQVLHHLLDGMSDAGIGQALGITEGTVGVHVRRIFRKLEVRSRGALVAKLQGRTG